MASICKRRFTVTVHDTAGGDGITVTIFPDVVSFSMRAVDSTGAPQAWTLADEGDLDSVFHFDAGEAYTEERLNLDQEQKLRVVAAAGTFELITWTR